MNGRSAFRAAMAAKTAADKRRVYWQTRAWLLTERGREAVKVFPDRKNEPTPTTDRQETPPTGKKNNTPAMDSPTVRK